MPETKSDRNTDRRGAVRAREARAGDIDALLALERSFAPEDRFSRRTWRRLVSGPSAVRVAERDGVVVGAASVLTRSGARVARLYSLATAPEARGAGVGSVLVADAENVARERGCDRLRLEVRAGNAPAIALYRRLQFQSIGERSSYYPDGETAIRMEKKLGGAHA